MKPRPGSRGSAWIAYAALGAALGCAACMHGAKHARVSAPPAAIPAPAATPPPTPAPDSDATRISLVLKKLSLPDPDRESQVRPALENYYAVLRAWHVRNDAHLQDLWNQFNAAAKTKRITPRDPPFIAIQAAYASLQPEHEKFVRALAVVLTPREVAATKDAMTQGRVAFNAKTYLQIIPELTGAQKKQIFRELEAAREAGMDALSPAEIFAFFKAHKNSIEQYINGQGYDFNLRYKAWLAKMQTQAAAKKAAAQTKPAPKPAQIN